MGGQEPAVKKRAGRCSRSCGGQRNGCCLPLHRLLRAAGQIRNQLLSASVQKSRPVEPRLVNQSVVLNDVHLRGGHAILGQDVEEVPAKFKVGGSGEGGGSASLVASQL